MRVVVRQAQTQQQRIRAEDFLEIVDDGNRAASRINTGWQPNAASSARNAARASRLRGETR